MVVRSSSQQETYGQWRSPAGGRWARPNLQACLTWPEEDFKIVFIELSAFKNFKISHEQPKVLMSGEMRGKGGSGPGSPRATALGWEGACWKGLGSAVVHVPGALGVFMPCPHLVQPLQVTNRRETEAVQSWRLSPELRPPVGWPPPCFPRGLRRDRKCCAFNFPAGFVSRFFPKKNLPERSPRCCCVWPHTRSALWRQLLCEPGPLFILGRNLWVEAHSS